MTTQRAADAIDRALDELSNEFRRFSDKMHKGFDSLDKRFDSIEQSLDSMLENRRDIAGKVETIHRFFDSMFYVILLTLGIILGYAIINVLSECF